MTREEAKKILTEYVKACHEDDMLTLEQFTYEEVIEAMDIGAEAISVLPVSSNLDEAAKKCVTSIIYEHGRYDGDFLMPVCEDIFKAGAEWMAGQGETYDCRVLLNGLSQYKIVQQTVKSFKPDEIVTVQIRKND